MAPLRKYFEALLAHYGPPKWWPADTPFEVMVGAILTQNTSWKNVEKAIHNLKVYDLLDARKIHELDQDTLAMAIKSAGTFNVKAARLKGFVAWFLARFDGDVGRMKQASPDRLREELLEVKGIGPETADAILLYALEMPVFVVDAYTHRMLTRRLDPFHLVLITVSAVLLVLSVGLARAGVDMVWCLAVLALVPWVTVVGYETVGNRHDAAVLAAAEGAPTA